MELDDRINRIADEHLRLAHYSLDECDEIALYLVMTRVYAELEHKTVFQVNKLVLLFMMMPPLAMSYIPMHGAS